MSPSETQTVAANLRKRRFQYTPVACEKCQRRKIRCSGDQPCERCRDSDATCIYPRKTRFRSRRQVSARSGQSTAAAVPGENVSESQDNAIENSSVSPSNESGGGGRRRSSKASIPGSFDYYVRLAESRLATRGPEQAAASRTTPQSGLIGAHQLREFISDRNGKSDGRALDMFDMDAWTETFQKYEEDIGMKYPFLDTEAFLQQLRNAKQDASTSSQPTSDGIRSIQQIGDISGLILSLVSGFADSDTVDVASPMVQEIFSATITRVHTNDVDQHDLEVLILTSMFFFLSDREVQAWRCIGTVMRLLQELCCHDSDNENVPDKLFWTVYTLDRRWSFGTGLSFGVPDADIARQPSFADDQSLSSAYLKQMVAYGRIASEVRTSLLTQASATPQPPNNYEAVRDFAHFRVIQWQKNLPRRLRFRGVDDTFDATREKRGDYKLRLMLYLRANQMRTIILRKSTTTSPKPMSMDSSAMESMAEVAQDTVRVLVNLARNTDIYHAQHRTFNHFLETALSSLLLVLCWTGPANGSPPCLGDTVAALDLIHQLSQHSHITQRLHQKLRVVQQVVEGLKSQDLGRSNIDPALNRPKPAEDGGTEVQSDHPIPEPEGSQPSDANILAVESRNSSAMDGLSQRNTQAGLSQTWLPPTNLGALDFSGTGSATATFPSFGPFGQSSPDMTMMNIPPNEFTSPQNVSSTSDASPQMVMDSQILADMQLPAHLFDLTESGFRDLNDILMDYDNFSF